MLFDPSIGVPLLIGNGLIAATIWHATRDRTVKANSELHLGRSEDKLVSAVNAQDKTLREFRKVLDKALNQLNNQLKNHK